MWRWLIPLAVIVVVAVGLVTTGQRTVRVPTPNGGTGQAPPGSFTDQPCDRGTPAPKTYKHVIWIWMGNRGYDKVVGKFNTDAVNTNTLADGCGLAVNYSAVASRGVPNLLAALSGSTQGRSDNTPVRLVVHSLFSQIPTWRVYMGGMATPCQATDSLDMTNGGYFVRDNPGFLLSTAGCAAHDRPGREFLPSLADGKLAPFTVVVPPACSSMSFTHGCVGVTKPKQFVLLGDEWLNRLTRRIFASSEYQTGSTAVFVTWTEAAKPPPSGHRCLQQFIPSCRVAMIAIAPWVKKAQFAGRLSHYSLLGETELLLGLKMVEHAHSSASMRAAFGL